MRDSPGKTVYSCPFVVEELREDPGRSASNKPHARNLVVWLALFAHWVPVTLQSVLFVGLLILGFTMIVAGWWRWRGVMREENTASWRKKMGLLGLVANTLALAVPFIVFFYAVASFGHRQQRNDWLVVFPTCLAFWLCGLICGVVAPPRIRFATAMGGLVVGSIILSIPIGIL